MTKNAVILAVLGWAAAAWGQPTISAVVNAASQDAAISPGCWVAITGSGLADATIKVDAAPLPTLLGGVSATVGGMAAELLYVSPTAIHLVVPMNTPVPENTVVPLIVTTDGMASRPYNLRLLHTAPGIFTRDGSGSGAALAFEGDVPAGTVAPGDTLTFYATGLGPVAGAAETVVENVDVYLGERKVEGAVVRRARGLAGLYRIDVGAPPLASDRLFLRAGGWQSNIVQIAIAGGGNLKNVTGTIAGLYPSTDPTAGEGTTFALMLHAGTFSTSFDIAPAAGRFDIAAVAEGGSALISIDPTAACTNDLGATSQGAYTAVIGTVTPDGARGDFSGSIYPLWDYLTCDPGTWECLAFPLSTIPASRLAPFWVKAIGQLPAATDLTSAGANAIAEVNGCLADLTPAGNPSHLVIDSKNNQVLSVFGGFVQLALGESKTRDSRFALYVDGVKIASTDVPYTAPARQ